MLLRSRIKLLLLLGIKMLLVLVSVKESGREREGVVASLIQINLILLSHLFSFKQPTIDLSFALFYLVVSTFLRWCKR